MEQSQPVGARSLKPENARKKGHLEHAQPPGATAAQGEEEVKNVWQQPRGATWPLPKNWICHHFLDEEKEGW